MADIPDQAASIVLKTSTGETFLGGVLDAAKVSVTSVPSDLYNTDGTKGKTEICTGIPHHFNDVPDYTGHATQAALTDAMVGTKTYTAGEKVTSIYINPWGASTFLGCYVTLNAATLAAAKSALQSVESNVTTKRYFVKAGVPRRIDLDTAITRVDLCVIDSGVDNNIELEAY